MVMLYRNLHYSEACYNEVELCVAKTKALISCAVKHMQKAGFLMTLVISILQG